LISIKNLEVFTWENFGRSIVLYVFCMVIRFLMLLLLKPVMNLTGYPMDIRHVVLMTWGALRGALGIFLAIIVDQNPKIHKKVKGVILFHASMIALYTLMINATTTPMLVQKLKLSKQTATTKKFMHLFLTKMDAESEKSQQKYLELHKDVDEEMLEEEVYL